jgi:hypothetical protein
MALVSKVRWEPEKMKKQADIAATATQNHQYQLDKHNEDIAAFETALLNQAKQRKELEDRKMQLVIEAERRRIEMSARQVRIVLVLALRIAAHPQHVRALAWCCVAGEGR